jgi:hypothetical protein
LKFSLEPLVTVQMVLKVGTLVLCCDDSWCCGGGGSGLGSAFGWIVWEFDVGCVICNGGEG